MGEALPLFHDGPRSRERPVHTGHAASQHRTGSGCAAAAGNGRQVPVLPTPISRGSVDQAREVRSPLEPKLLQRAVEDGRKAQTDGFAVVSKVGEGLGQVGEVAFPGTLLLVLGFGDPR
jgi:hypothetical protein